MVQLVDYQQTMFRPFRRVLSEASENLMNRSLLEYHLVLPSFHVLGSRVGVYME